MIRQVPAVLQAGVETETDFGGRARLWSAVATVWVTLAPGDASEAGAQGQRPVRMETASAQARDHPDAAVGQQLVLASETPWRVLAVRRATPKPGAMTLLLDRAL